MARATKKRAFFALWCKDCKEKHDKRHENYKILLNTQNTEVKQFEINKFCKHCRKYGIHKTKQISRSQNK
jgi:ribosomal protein L33